VQSTLKPSRKPTNLSKNNSTEKKSELSCRSKTGFACRRKSQNSQDTKRRIESECGSRLGNSSARNLSRMRCRRYASVCCEQYCLQVSRECFFASIPNRQTYKIKATVLLCRDVYETLRHKIETRRRPGRSRPRLDACAIASE